MPAVRKKILEVTGGGDSMNLARHLTRVREAIQTLPTEEHEMQNENAATEPANETKATTRKAKKTVKKVAKKKTGAVKKAAPASDQITLSAIAKSLKMEPRKARRILRGSELKSIEVDGARWTWKKGSNAHEAVVKVLKAADAD